MPLESGVESSAGDLKMRNRFSAPSTLVFIISLVIAAIAALTALGSVSLLPIASVWIMAVAYAVLAVGCLVRGA